MKIYCFLLSPTLCEVDVTLYVQEVQLDKFRQDLGALIAVVNIAHTSQEESSSRGAFSNNRGKGNIFAHGRGRGSYPTGNWPTCQLCGKYGHYVTTRWHRFDEKFMPQSATNAQPSPTKSSKPS